MTRLSYIAIKKVGEAFRIVNKDLFQQELSGLPEGRYRIIVEKYRKNKSLPQLGYYFACIIPMSWRLLTDAGWEFSSEDEVDAFWKDLYGNREIVNRDTGEVMTIPHLKRDMTTTEMMTFINAIRNHCSEFLGGYIPEPESQIEMQLDNSKTF